MGMSYLHWAKVHPRVRYELTNSGVPTLSPEDFGDDPAPLPLEVRGAYGDPELIDRIAARYSVVREGVVPVPGASSAIFVGIAAAVEIGAPILVEQPVYEPIARVADFLRLRVTKLPRRPNENFGVDLDGIEDGLRDGARAVVLTNLHNPSGRLLQREQIKEIAACCERCGAVLIVDEVYLDAHSLTNGIPPWTAANLSACAIGLNSLTKVYGLSGLRIGWVLAKPAVADHARSVMNLLSSDNAAPSMALAIRAFRQMPRLEDRYRRLFENGQAVFRRWLEGEPLLRGYDSAGAIFECLRLPNGVDADSFNDLLVREFETQVTPGSFFDLPDHIRLSTWLHSDDLKEALSRISQALRKIPLAPR